MSSRLCISRNLLFRGAPSNPRTFAYICRSRDRALHTARPTNATEDPFLSEHAFFTGRSAKENLASAPDPADVGRTIQILTTRLPFILKEGALPNDILSDAITLEILPTTLGLPEIKGKTAYTTISRLAVWSIKTLMPRAQFVIDSQRLLGSARRCECLIVRFRLQEKQETLYTGLFHFHFDGKGKVSRHVFEVVDGRFTPTHLVDWIMGRMATKPTVPVYNHKLNSLSHK